jgi:hypothetical protein
MFLNAQPTLNHHVRSVGIIRRRQRHRVLVRLFSSYWAMVKLSKPSFQTFQLVAVANRHHFVDGYSYGDTPRSGVVGYDGVLF